MSLIDVPVPDDAARHFPTATVVLNESIIVTSWVEGSASHRIGLLDLQTGHWRVAKGPRGTLRAALSLGGSRALLLTDYALTEIDLVTLEHTRKLTAKIGKYNTSLRRDRSGDAEGDDDLVVVGNSSASMESLVSLSSFTVVRRRRRQGGDQPEVGAAEISVAEARAGVARILSRGSGVVLAASEPREAGPQRLLVLADGDLTVIADVAAPDGIAAAFLVEGGVIAAAPDMGVSRTLTVLPTPVSAASAHGVLALDDLISAANDSAAALLTASARRRPPRTVYRDHRLEPCGELSDVSARRVTLENCVAWRAVERDERPRIARVSVTDLELQSSSLNGAVFDDVTIDGLRFDAGTGFLFGCEFRRVTLTGRVRGLIVNTGLNDPDPAVEARYAEWYHERLADPEWMLDITHATGDITIRGYPSRFIRRNPELHAVVPAAAVATDEWKSVDAGGSTLWVALQELARSDWEDVTLVANPHGSHATDDLAYLQRLRAKGIAQAIDRGENQLCDPRRHGRLRRLR